MNRSLVEGIGVVGLSYELKTHSMYQLTKLTALFLNTFILMYVMQAWQWTTIFYFKVAIFFWKESSGLL